MKKNTSPTLPEKKDKAVEIMRTLDIYEPYIRGFKQSDRVCYYEGFGGFWVEQKPEIEAKMKEVENRYDCKVYAITHEFTDFGELWDFLLVTNYPEDWENAVYSYEGNKHIVCAYVWNKTDEDCSELGSIAVESFGGGIRRLG